MNTLLTAAQENSDVDLMQNAVNVVEGTLWGAGIGVLCLGICFALDKLFTLQDKRKRAQQS